MNVSQLWPQCIPFGLKMYCSVKDWLVVQYTQIMRFLPHGVLVIKCLSDSNPHIRGDTL